MGMDDITSMESNVNPHRVLHELLGDIDAFRRLEKDAGDSNGNSTIIMYWDALAHVVKDELSFIQNGGEDSSYAKKIKGIKAIFEGQSQSDLMKMKEEIELDYWRKYGKPECIEPELFKSSVNEGEFYETYLRMKPAVMKDQTEKKFYQHL